MNGFRLLEMARPAIVISPQVIAASTAVNGLWMDMSNVGKAAVMIVGQINGTNSGGSLVVTILQASAHAGTGSKAWVGAFTTAYIQQNSTTDSWTQTTGLTGTLTMVPTGNGSVQSMIALIDIDPSTLDLTNGFNHIRVVITGGSTQSFAGAIVFQKIPRIASPVAAPDALAT